MDIRAVEQFVVVADELNVTRAAERLFAAQSTVSAGLRSLERELGTTLLERTTRRVWLTEAGERVLPEARALLAAYGRMRDGAADDTAGLRGRVRMGTFAALDVLGLPHLIREFREQHPLVDLALVVSRTGSSGFADDLRRGRLDLAFSALPVDPGADIATEQLAQFPYVALLPPGHRLAERSRVRLDELEADPWIDTAAGYGNRVMLDAELTRRGLRRRLVVELGDLPSVPTFVAAGVGVAVVPDAIPTKGCVRVEIADPPAPWVLSLCWRREPGPGAAARELRALLRAVAADLPERR
jgi:DNA-binding transcriptional LysR family regulator